MASTLSTTTLINLLKRSIPIPIIPPLSLSASCSLANTTRKPANRRPLTVSVSGTPPPPEFPSLRYRELDQGSTGTTPPEVPLVPKDPPEIDPSGSPDEFTTPIIPPPGPIEVPNPPGPDSPGPPIPSPPVPEIVPPPGPQPPEQPIPPEISPPPTIPPPPTDPPSGPAPVIF